MTDMEVREFAERLFAKGKEYGFADMEVYVEDSEDFTVRIFKSEIDEYSVSSTRGLGFRGEYEGKIGYSFTEKLDEASIDILLEDARDNALVVDSEDVVEIHPPAESYPQVDTFAPSLEQVTPDEKIAFARELESEALKLDERIEMVNFSLFVGFAEGRQIINTKGVDLRGRRNGAAGLVWVVAADEKSKKSAMAHKLVSTFTELNPKELARRAVNEAVSLLGADTVPSGTYPVVLRYDVARELLQTFASVFSADAVQKGLSLLEGKLGERVAASAVTVLDDPLLPYGALSQPFDAEGIPARTKRVIDAGTLTTFLHNSKTAKKDGVDSTGNAFRASFKSPVGVAPTNMFIEKGEISFDELIGNLEDGLLITDIQGTHSGANPVSGDFSLAAGGFRISGGTVQKPVEQITIAGNFLELLQDVEAVGSDFEFGLPQASGCFGSPSLLVKKLAVAGN